MPSASAMLPPLAAAAREARQRAGASTAEVARRANVDVSTVRRFERARAWPHDPDELLAAYAAVARTSPLRIWRAALDDGEDQPRDP